MGDLSSGGIQNWERGSLVLGSQSLTVSMSRNWLFLGGLHSCSARFRFTSRIHLHPIRLEL
jgi:hypothetical protein